MKMIGEILMKKSLNNREKKVFPLISLLPTILQQCQCERPGQLQVDATSLCMSRGYEGYSDVSVRARC